MVKKLQKKVKPKKNQGGALIVLGLVLLSVFSLWRANRARILSFNTKGAQVVAETEGTRPTHINIPRLRVDLDIRESSIINGVWQISQDTASHLDSSSGLGGGGNIVVYGHNKTSIFGPIRWLSKGDILELTGEDSKTYTFAVEYTVEVDPDNLEYILAKDSEVLTLYTCTGFLDSKRFVAVAKRVE